MRRCRARRQRHGATDRGDRAGGIARLAPREAQHMPGLGRAGIARDDRFAERRRLGAAPDW